MVLTIALHLPEQCVPFPIKPALHKHSRWLPTEISLQKALESQKMPSHDPSAEMTPKKSGYWNNSLFCAFAVVVVVIYLFIYLFQPLSVYIAKNDQTKVVIKLGFAVWGKLN